MGEGGVARDAPALPTITRGAVGDRRATSARRRTPDEVEVTAHRSKLQAVQQFGHVVRHLRHRHALHHALTGPAHRPTRTLHGAALPFLLRHSRSTLRAVGTLVGLSGGHGLGNLFRRNFGRTLRADQLWPLLPPVKRAKIPTSNLAACRLFDGGAPPDRHTLHAFRPLADHHRVHTNRAGQPCTRAPRRSGKVGSDVHSGILAHGS